MNRIKEFSCGCQVELGEDSWPVKTPRMCAVLESRLACVEPYPEKWDVEDSAEYDCYIEHLYGGFELVGTKFIPVPSKDQLPEADNE